MIPMKNKVLVQLIVPDMEESYDIYIPINRKVGNIIGLLSKAISELTNGVYPISKKTSLYNAETGERYPIDNIILDTNIRNGTKLILF